MNRRYLYLLLIVALAWAWRDWSQRPVPREAGILVPEQPRQSAEDLKAPFRIDEFQITPRAEFSIRARVLSRENYWLGGEADLSPIDLALGWGPMSDQAVLDRIEIRQSGRWYYTQYDFPAPLSDVDIIRNSANMHMIPANDYVKSRLKDVRPGDIVRIRGQLVDVDHSSGFYWRTSVRRDDTGGGSCEIIHVEQIQLELRPD